MFGVRVLALALAFAVSAAVRAGAVSSPQDQAGFLAGLPLSGGPLAELQKSVTYQRHREELAEKWDYCRKARWNAMQSWARKNLPRSSTRGVVRYLFGGPDFLAAHAFFPDAHVLVLGGLEPVGAVLPPESLPPAALDASLAATRRAMGTALFAGYFVTREMNAQLRLGNFRGVLPLLYAQLALTGNKIVSVEMVRPFGSPGVKIGYRRGMRGTQTLYYFQANLADGPECGRFLSWLASLGEGASYLKAASYLMHRDGFSQVRSFLLDTSTLIVEDDSGIPFRHFDPERWKIKLFGEYNRPIFSGYYQNDFRDAYATRGNAGPLPFGAGYQVFSDQANILLATRSGAVRKSGEPRPAQKPVPEIRPAGTLSAKAVPGARPAGAVPARDKTRAPAPSSVVAKSKPAAQRSSSGTVYLADVAPESAPKPASVIASSTAHTSRKSLVMLEAEELRIRQDPALTREERMRKLRAIWQEQLAVTGKTSG